MKFLIILLVFLYIVLQCDAQISICRLNETKCFSTKHFNTAFDIQMEKKWEFIDPIFQAQTPIAFDIDLDCIPEVISAAYDEGGKDWGCSSKILVFESNARNLLSSFSTYFFFAYIPNSFIILNNKDKIEIIVSVADIPLNPINVRGKLVCYNFDNSIKWVSDQKYSVNSSQFGSLSCADFNQDGIPEVFIFNNIFNAYNGRLLAIGGNYGIGGNFGSISIAADLDDDPTDLELAAGYTVYDVSILNPNGTLGNTMFANNILINGESRDGFTAIADMNNDKQLDVIVVSTSNLYSVIYIYSYINQSYELIAKKEWLKYESFGPISIGKVNSEKELGMILNSSKAIRKFSYSSTTGIVEDWSFVNTDDSGLINSILYDFNNDSINEIVYRDETDLVLLSATNNTPIILSKLPCISLTTMEKPILATFDDYENSMVCVSCANKFADQFGKLVVFGPPPGQHWAPARNIWHQYAYNPLFINDDGTVPQYMHNPATYKNGKYNNFMVQESLIDEDGNYPVAAASLTGEMSCLHFDANTSTYSLEFSIFNRADASLSAPSGVVISFYDGDPAAGGTLLGSYVTTSPIIAGAALSLLPFSVPSTSIGPIFMVVNDGHALPECDYIDNIFQTTLPKVAKESTSICQGESLDFFGTALTAAGTYYHVQSQISGCDSVVNVLDLAISQIKTTTIHETSCGAFTWNGTPYLASGTYTHTGQSVFGCDSITTLQLTVNQLSAVQVVESACDSFVWNGQTYIDSQMANHQSLNTAGCDSTTTLVLTVFRSDHIDQNVSTCNSYTWNGKEYLQSGIYTHQAKNIHGCDSISTLKLTVSNTIQTDVNAIICDKYTWNNLTYDQSGDYPFQSISSQGCDSIATLHLTINTSSASTESQSSCESFVWNGQIYHQSGQYTFKTQNAVGCDSTASLDLTILQATTSEANISACDQYQWQGKMYDTSGVFVVHMLNQAGCDSTAQLNLTIQKSDHIQLMEKSCESYTWNQELLNQSGIYTQNLQNIHGCDSLISLQLTIYHADTSHIQASVCDSFVMQGITYDKEGEYQIMMQNVFGCDSTINLNLSILSSMKNEYMSQCDEFTWPVNGQTYTTSGIYRVQFTNVAGCDSIQILDLQIHPSYESKEQHEECGPFTWNVDQKTYTSSGEYVIPLKTTEGCDSIFTLQLDIHPQYQYIDTIESKEDYTWPVNDVTYTTSGIYEQKYMTEYDCDSLYILDLRINKSRDLYFPNIISTTGGNTHFTAYGSDATIEDMSIYDRWGNLVFQTKNVVTNDPSLGWNGKFKNQAVVSGVFVWVVTVRYADGTKKREQATLQW